MVESSAGIHRESLDSALIYTKLNSLFNSFSLTAYHNMEAGIYASDDQFVRTELTAEEFFDVIIRETDNDAHIQLDAFFVQFAEH